MRPFIKALPALLFLFPDSEDILISFTLSEVRQLTEPPFPSPKLQGLLFHPFLKFYRFGKRSDSFALLLLRRGVMTYVSLSYR